MEAFEELYHPDVTIVEASGESRKGKDTQRKAIHEWMESLAEMHGGGTSSVTANEEAAITMVESWTDITDKKGRRMKFDEVAVQKWQDGQIIHERFYYFVPAEMQM